MSVLSLSCVDISLKDNVIVHENLIGVCQGIYSKSYTQHVSAHLRKYKSLSGLNLTPFHQLGFIYDEKPKWVNGDELTPHISVKEDDGLLFIGNRCKYPNIMDISHQIFTQTDDHITQRYKRLLDGIKETGLDFGCINKDMSCTSLYYGLYNKKGELITHKNIQSNKIDPIDSFIKSP